MNSYSFPITHTHNQASSLMGSPMTYSLFEYAKDHQDELMAREEGEVEEKVSESCTATASDQVSSATSGSKSKPKVQLSKAAKRRHADKLSEYNNEREGERGREGVV